MLSTEIQCLAIPPEVAIRQGRHVPSVLLKARSQNWTRSGKQCLEEQGAVEIGSLPRGLLPDGCCVWRFPRALHFQLMTASSCCMPTILLWLLLCPVAYLPSYCMPTILH